MWIKFFLLFRSFFRPISAAEKWKILSRNYLILSEMIFGTTSFKAKEKVRTMQRCSHFLLGCFLPSFRRSQAASVAPFYNRCQSPTLLHMVWRFLSFCSRIRSTQISRILLHPCCVNEKILLSGGRYGCLPFGSIISCISGRRSRCAWFDAYMYLEGEVGAHGLTLTLLACISRYKPWESLWGSSAITPLADFHHRLTACPSY